MRGKKAVAEEWPAHTTSERRVIGVFNLIAVPWLAGGMNLCIPPFVVWFLWGTWQPFPYVCYSLAVLAYAVALGLKGWKPWRMALYTTLADGKSDWWDTDPFAMEVGEFLRTPRIRWTGAAIIATATVTPWIVTGVSHLFGGVPLRRITAAMTWQNEHPVAMLVLGYADAVRAGTLAMVWMKRQLRKNWSRLRDDVSRGQRGGAD